MSEWEMVIFGNESQILFHRHDIQVYVRKILEEAFKETCTQASEKHCVFWYALRPGSLKRALERATLTDCPLPMSSYTVDEKVPWAVEQI